jgi:hypothetical protein
MARGKIILAALLVLPGAVLGTGESLKIPFLEAELEIDAHINEPAWEHALLVPLVYETRPGENTEPPVRTEALLLDTGASFAVAFRAFDPNPDQIRAYFRDRDSLFNDDFVGVKLDTYNDSRRALEFFVNPFGAQLDAIEDDVNKREDDAWDAIWESAGRITEFGYVVEMEIPYGAMSLPPTQGEKTWGIDVLRFYPRGVTHRISNSPQDRNKECVLCQISRFHGFERARQGRNLEITPTLVAVRADSREELSAPLVSGDADSEFGLDVNWGITSNITLNGTLNPDFSQVEADVAQLNVNQTFALFFPEKRPFFLENADYFDSRIRAVFTRNVVDPDYGLRVTGKLGDGVMGAFFAEDTVTSFLIPGSQGSSIGSFERSSTDAVLRYRRDLPGNSSVGVIGTARSADGYHNYLAGVDALYRPTESDRINAQVLTSRTLYPDEIVTEFDQPTGEFDGDAISLSYNHDERDWFSYVNYDEFDRGFRADMGFVGKVDFDRWIVGAGRVWYPEDVSSSWWNRIQLNGDWDKAHDQSGQLLEEEWEARLSVEGPLQSFVQLAGTVRERFWNGTLFDEKSIRLFSEFTPRRGLYLRLSVREGDQVDFANTQLGEVLNIRPQIRWSLGRHLSLDLRHTYEKFDRREGRLYEVNLSDLRLAYQFDLKQRLRLVLQYQDITRNPALYVDEVDTQTRGLGGQLIYSYKVNPRTLFFAGYGEGDFEDDSVEDLTTLSRTLFVKLSYAWEPSF